VRVPSDDAAREERVNVMAMRAHYKDVFEKKHGTKLGFMGFFTKACVQA